MHNQRLRLDFVLCLLGVRFHSLSRALDGLNVVGRVHQAFAPSVHVWGTVLLALPVLSLCIWHVCAGIHGQLLNDVCVHSCIFASQRAGVRICLLMCSLGMNQCVLGYFFISS